VAAAGCVLVGCGAARAPARGRGRPAGRVAFDTAPGALVARHRRSPASRRPASVLEADAAGQQLLTLLRLGEAAHELDGLGETAGEGAQHHWSLSRFSAWVREVLEGAGFQPEAEGVPQVVVLPLAQRMGRSFAAVVAPGCDERHLPASPEPGGTWTHEQRLALGLADREALRQAHASDRKS